MQDILLFVYPDTRYFEHEQKDLGFSLGSPECCKYVFPRFDRLINARYRLKGFKVYWLLFSEPDNELEPDLRWITTHLTVYPTDSFLASGITRDQLNQEIYADPVFVQSQLQGELGKVVITGFHEADCVDKFAAHFHHQGLDVMVDTDLTNLGLSRLAHGLTVPVHRISFEAEQYIGRQGEVGNYYQEMLLSHWEEFPWTRQRRMYEVTGEEIRATTVPEVSVTERVDTELGFWEVSGRSHAVYYIAGGKYWTYGHINVVGDRFIAVDYNRVPPHPENEKEAYRHTAVCDFSDFDSAAEWLENRTAESPRIIPQAPEEN